MSTIDKMYFSLSQCYKDYFSRKMVADSICIDDGLKRGFIGNLDGHDGFFMLRSSATNTIKCSHVCFESFRFPLSFEL